MNIITRKQLNSDVLTIGKVCQTLIDNNLTWAPIAEMTSAYEMHKIGLSSQSIISSRVYSVAEIKTTTLGYISKIIFSNVFRNKFNKITILFYFEYNNSTLTIPVWSISEKIFIVETILPLFSHIPRLTIDVVSYFNE